MGISTLAPATLRAAVRLTAGQVVKARSRRADMAWKIADLVKLRAANASTLDPDDFKFAAQRLECDPVVIHAIADAESAGAGFTRDKRLVIAFEPHIFSRATNHAFDLVNPRVSYPRFVKYSDWKSGRRRPKHWDAHPLDLDQESRWMLWAEAADLDVEAACRAISVGRFQVLGNGYGLLGFRSAEDVVRHAYQSELAQLDLMTRFCVARNLLRAMQTRDFARIERIYNGGGHNGAYAAKMERAVLMRAAHYHQPTVRQA